MIPATVAPPSRNEDFAVQWFREFPEPVWMLDSLGRVVDTNHQAEVTLGLSASEQRDRKLADLIGLGSRERDLLLEAAAGLCEHCPDVTIVARGREASVDLVFNLLGQDGVRRLFVYARDASERRVWRRAVEDQHGRLAEAQRLALLGSWEWEVGRDVSTCSDEMSRILGHRPANFREFLALVPPPDRDALQGQVADALASGLPYELEHRIVRPDGVERVLLSRGQVIMGPVGPVRLVGTAQDVTDRVELQTMLSAREERLVQLTEHIEEVFYLSDPGSGEILYVSPAFEKTWGRPSESLYADRGVWLASVDPADGEVVRDATRRNARGEATVIEYRITRPDGTTRWIRDRAVPFLDAQGVVHRVAGFCHDVTEARLAEDALRRRERQLAEAQRLAAMGSWEWDLSSQIHVWSDGMYRVCGCDPATTRPGADTFEALLHPDDRAAAATAWERVRTSGEDMDTMVRIVRPDGTVRRVRSTAHSVRDEHGALVRIIGTVQDVTERERADDARRALEDQLRQAQKMEAVGRLAGGVAHDFNNILTAILGYAEFLMADLTAGDPRRQDVVEIRKAADRAASLTRQLLAFSRQQVLAPQAVDLNQTVQAISQMLRRLIGEDVALVTDLAPQVDAVLVDPGQIEQVLLNLAVNARDAMPNGGRLTIRSANVVFNDGSVELPDGVGPGRYVRLSVADTGCGMEDAVRARIFEPFFTTKPQGQGTGLGLATVFGIVAQSGGGLSVTSSVGNGTAFDVYLPASDARPGAAGAESSPVAEGGGEMILLVEDEAPVRALIREALARRGYRVLEAVDGSDGLELARQHQGHLDLILTDIVMPRRSGAELAAALRPSAPDVPVVFMSGYTEDSAALRRLREAGNLILPKPFAPEALCRKVREVLDGRAPAGV